jgi:hypothetical protein
MGRLTPRFAVIVLSFACAHCYEEYHPDYHPEYGQHVTYSRVYNLAGAGENALAVASKPPLAQERGCSMGRAAACWNECFHESRGWSCELLGVMFRTGEGVFPDQATADRLHERACALGQCGPRGATAPGAGVVTSPGSVVVYGDMNGNVVLGH